MADRRGGAVGDLTIRPPTLLLCPLKGASYFALAVFAAGAAAMTFVQVSGACPRLDEGAVRCASPAAEALGGIGVFLLLTGGLTVVPALLAMAGLVFLSGDVLRAVRLSRTRDP